MHFNPRPPRGGRLRRQELISKNETFQSTPPARGATSKFTEDENANKISIHAPREGGDGIPVQCPLPFSGFQSTPPARGATLERDYIKSRQKISIHAPREGGDNILTTQKCTHSKFQSTPPARGATRSARQEVQELRISIHAPREGGDPAICVDPRQISISIHAPREGGDWRWICPLVGAKIFQSTPPARGATGQAQCE